MLPEGPLTSQTDGLVWERLQIKGRECLAANIPEDRELDFVDGEGKRCHTTFYLKQKEIGACSKDSSPRAIARLALYKKNEQNDTAEPPALHSLAILSFGLARLAILLVCLLGI